MPTQAEESKQPGNQISETNPSVPVEYPDLGKQMAKYPTLNDGDKQIHSSKVDDVSDDEGQIKETPKDPGQKKVEEQKESEKART